MATAIDVKTLAIFALSFPLLTCWVPPQDKSPAAPTLDKKSFKASESLNRAITGPLKEDPIAEQIGEYVTELFVDQDHNFWMGTLGKGVARHDGTKLEYFISENGLSPGAVTSIAQGRDGNIWFGTHGGLSKFDGKIFTTVQWPEGVNGKDCRVQSDSNGDIWVGNMAGVFRKKGDEFEPFELPISKLMITYYAIHPGKASMALQDRKGNYWFKTDGFGAIRFDGKTFKRFTKADGLCSNNITNIVEDQTGRIWFTCMQSYQPAMTGDGGVCYYDGNVIQQLDVKGLANKDIYSIFKDLEGDLWIGATGLGIYRYDGNSFKLYDDIERRNDLTKFIGVQRILQRPDGTMWFGFSGGLFRLIGDRVVNVSKKGRW